MHQHKKRGADLGGKTGGSHNITRYNPGFCFNCNGISFAKIGNFIDIPSMVIVIGGALSATLSSYPLGILKDIPKHFAVLIRGNRYNVPKLIEQLVDLGTIARQSGLLALEDKAAEIKNPFFKQSVLMIVDANDPDKVRLLLERELDNMMVRHDQAAGLYEKAASYAPSFGMIGTLIGLINMLKGMNMDAGGSSTIGSDMSVALITTFYGCILANVIFNPIAKKLGSVRMRKNCIVLLSLKGSLPYRQEKIQNT